jgi:hypothetical protein
MIRFGGKNDFGSLSLKIERKIVKKLKKIFNLERPRQGDSVAKSLFRDVYLLVHDRIWDSMIAFAIT